MLKNLKELYKLLTAEQRNKLLLLQIFVILMSVVEVASVLAIGPFMALVGDISQLEGDGLLAQIYRQTDISTPADFLFMVALFALATLTLAAAISTFTIWQLSMYGNKVGAELSNRLFKYYMHQSWLFHVGTNSSQLTNRISRECARISGGIINPLMQMNAKLVMAIAMALAIFIYNPVVALTGIGVFSGAYWLLYTTVRRSLARHGTQISEQEQLRFKLMSEGFGGIKDTLLLGRQNHFVERFGDASDKVAHATGNIQVLGQAPRYAMELIAFGTIIFLLLYLLFTHDGDLGTILPVLSVYAIAGFKLLPAFQQIYGSVSSIRGNLSGFETLHEDLRNSMSFSYPSASRPIQDHLAPGSSISLRDITFRYPGAHTQALDKLNIEIPANKVIGFVGASGSGKSTTIDILLGLLTPDSGQMLIDGKSLHHDNLRAWQNSLGYVAQSIYLADASIRQNIAFGLPDTDIDHTRVSHAATLAHLDELLNQLPDGLDTTVGERGVQLSGGQRQRIGIARALYHDADILIFDEATSALDGITEKMIMDAIHDFSGKKTIVLIAHRLATVRKCDCIYLLTQGKVVDHGTYDELRERNPLFRQMADIS